MALFRQCDKKSGKRLTKISRAPFVVQILHGNIITELLKKPCKICITVLK
jgi:hypothetical protein